MDTTSKTTSHAANLTEMTDRERTHVPMIELPDIALAGQMFPVTVKAGGVPHAMEPGHSPIH